MEYTIDDLIEDLLQEKDWDIDEGQKNVLVPGLPWTLFGM